ncbi:MAG: glutamate--tRNA ligase, partial [Candidatus Marinimicrobia bacterium]|nr:glutamate--tRNA ligase [Candidatus Neomarinimicrobiota bacterium]
AGDILDYQEFFLTDEAIEYEEKAFRKRLVNANTQRELLKKLRKPLAETPEYSAHAIEALLRSFVEQEETGLGMIVHALRVALTGKAVGFGLFEILAILGKQSCLTRIDRAIKLAEEAASSNE